MVEDVLARVEERLEAVGLSATAASKLAGLSEDAIRNMRRAVEKGDRKGVTTRTVSALAPVLRTTAGYLMSGEGDGEAPALRSVPLTGYIGAGDAAHFYGDDQGEFGRVDTDDPDAVSARELRGRSMGRLLEGWLAFTGERQHGVPESFIGRICEVRLPDGRVLIKKVSRSKLPGLFNLLSETEDPMLDEEVEWSAVVTSMRPR